jgi:hypothetical protein
MSLRQGMSRWNRATFLKFTTEAQRPGASNSAHGVPVSPAISSPVQIASEPRATSGNAKRPFKNLSAA